MPTGNLLRLSSLYYPLQNLDYELNECQALVLAPTRELAQQIEKVMRALGDYLKVKCHACVGGTSVREDTRILQVRGGFHRGPAAKCCPAGVGDRACDESQVHGEEWLGLGDRACEGSQFYGEEWHGLGGGGERACGGRAEEVLRGCWED